MVYLTVQCHRENSREIDMAEEIYKPNNNNMRCSIVQTARELFDSQGFDNTTIHDLIDRLDISDTLFFAHFQSLDELLEIVWSES